METSLNRERNTLTPVTGNFKDRSDPALVLSPVLTRHFEGFALSSFSLANSLLPGREMLILSGSAYHFL